MNYFKGKRKNDLKEYKRARKNAMYKRDILLTFLIFMQVYCYNIIKRTEMHAFPGYLESFFIKASRMLYFK